MRALTVTVSPCAHALTVSSWTLHLQDKQKTIENLFVAWSERFGEWYANEAEVSFVLSLLTIISAIAYYRCKRVNCSLMLQAYGNGRVLGCLLSVNRRVLDCLQIDRLREALERA